jgi:hypothetical protein
LPDAKHYTPTLRISNPPQHHISWSSTVPLQTS